MKHVASIGLLAAVLTVAAPAPARAEPPAHARPPSVATPVEKDLPARAAGRARRYWTPQRMAAAIPVDVVQYHASGDDPAPVPLASGDPVRIEPSEPSEQSDTGSTNEVTRNSPIRYRRYEVTDPAVRPNSTSGKVFFTDEGTEYACSGTVVTSKSMSLVWTAGHCVRDGGANGRWHRNWTFVPAYDGDADAFGEWGATDLASVLGWTEHGNLNYDLGVAIVKPRADGVRLEQLVGGRGMAWNLRRNQEFTAFGYPTKKPFDGKTLIACESSYGGRDPYNDSSGPVAQWIGCDMSAGASGGGWIVSGGYLNSLTSYTREGVKGTIYGPYFGDAAAKLYGQVRDGTVPRRRTYRRSLSLRLRRHLVASGALTADGYRACAQGAPVRILKRRGSRWTRIKTVRTGDHGRYRARIPDARGTYKAVAPYRRLNEYRRCAQANSPRRRHP